MLHDSSPYVLVPQEIGKPLLGGSYEDGIKAERERVKRVIDFYSARIDHNRWSRRDLLDMIFEDVDKGTNYLFEKPSKPPVPVILASGVSEKGREMYRMYEERFGTNNSGNT